jgi:hypothetical protein
MKITISATNKIVELNGVPARVWEGETEHGVPVHCFVTRVAVPEGLHPSRYEQFEAELTEQQKPSAAVDAIPLRLVL